MIGSSASSKAQPSKKPLMKIPVTIITGFLGSGKTTLICGLLKKNPDRRLAVLVNEFGEISVDGALLRTAGEACGVEIHDLPNGCISCTINDDFLPIMQQLQARKHEIDHVLIETSGLALPTPVMRALAWPEIRNDFQLDAVLTVVDTPQLLAGGLEKGSPVPGSETAEAPAHLASVDAILNEQLENADVAILNKIDALTDEELMRAEELVRQKAPRLRFLELAYHAELDTRLCMGLNVHEQPVDLGGHSHAHGGHHHHGPVHEMPLELTQPLANQGQFDGHAHTGLGAHEHGEDTHLHFHEHDTGWQSFVVRSGTPQDAERVKEAVRQVTLKHPVLRAKGFAAVAGKNSRLVLQAVRSRVNTYFEEPKAGHDHDHDHEHDHDHDHEHTHPDSSLVFIGYHLPRESVVALMRELTGAHWH